MMATSADRPPNAGLRDACTGCPGKISLIIPVYNEAAHLPRFLEVIDRLRLPVPCELVFVNDGSSDASREILRQYPFRCDVRFVELQSNSGKGAAVAAGIRCATGSIVGIQDADFEYRFEDISCLVRPLIEARADVVFGSRFCSGTKRRRWTVHHLANRVLTLASNLSTGMALTDMETCYKFFRADVIRNICLTSPRFGIEPEITAKIARLNLRILEVPIGYTPRRYEEGKKVTWRDGLAALWHIAYFNFLDDRRQWFHAELPREFILEG